MTFMKTGLLSVLSVVLLCGAALPQSDSKGPSKSFGIRAGYGSNPDQFVIGAQAVLGRTMRFMRFAPSFDIGTGDNMTTYLLNADLRLLSYEPRGATPGLYAGAGAAIGLLDHSMGGSDTEIGVNAVGGLMLPMGRKNTYNLELRFGFGDMPDLRILFGVMFGGRS